MDGGEAWVVDAFGCDPAALRSASALGAVFDAVVKDLRLNPVAPAVWHAFPPPGGVTGFLVLRESHLACHTYPEHGFAAFDLYACAPGREWPWAGRLAGLIGARRVVVRRLPRGGGTL